MNIVRILDVPFTDTDHQTFIHTLNTYINNQRKAFIVTANPEIVMQANDQPEFMELLQQATHIVADGIGIVKAAQLLNTPLPGRVTGYDLMIDLLEQANEEQYSVYLLGAEQM